MSGATEWKVLGRATSESSDLVVEIQKLSRRDYSLKIGRANGERDAVLPFLPVSAKVEGGVAVIAFPDDEIGQLLADAKRMIESDVANEFDRWQAEREADEIATLAKTRGQQHKVDAKTIEEAKAAAHPGYRARGTR